MLGMFLASKSNQTCPKYLILYLDDLSQLRAIDWASAIEDLILFGFSEIAECLRSEKSVQAKRCDKDRRQPILFGCSTALLVEDAILPTSEEQWLISPKENYAESKICCTTCVQMRTELEEVKKRLVIAENLLNLLLKQEDIANKEKDEEEEGDDGEEVEGLWEEEPRMEKKRKHTSEKKNDIGDK
ncbi:hypothetical protein COCNU_scaffold083562G000040 [Cocos nucifera]|nr:hypothetical protein [Cocos nucifera]